MSDQAETLRKLMEQRGSPADEGGSMPQVFVVASPLLGTTKTKLVTQLSTLLGREGLRVLLIDAVMPVKRLQTHTEAYARRLGQNLWFLPLEALPIQLENPSEEFDVVMIDTGGGLKRSVTPLHSSLYSPLFRSVVVLTPERNSVASAYELISELKRRNAVERFGIIVNQVTDGRAAREIFRQLTAISVKTLDVQLDYLGHVACDENFNRTVVKPKFLVNSIEGSGAGATVSLELLAKRFRESGSATGKQVNMKGFWRTLMGP